MIGEKFIPRPAPVPPPGAVPRSMVLVRRPSALSQMVVLFAPVISALIGAAVAAVWLLDGEPRGFREGSWTVGEQMPAGTYATAGDGARSCRWWTTDPASGRIIVRPDSQITDAVPAAVVLKAGTVFHSDGCGTWYALEQP